jgi:farnesyl diphosphate synthase
VFDAVLSDAAKAVSVHLAQTLAPYEGSLGDAMRYACHGGKRLRAFLVLEGARLHAVPTAPALDAAAAIEAIHAYSLVHDDLPSMDDDDLRRGLPTVHVKWDEATGILVGDALQSHAFALLAGMELSEARRLSLISGMAQAAGGDGMVLGQALDIAAETAEAPLTLDQIKRLQAKKTGALFEWSATAGAVMAGADPAPLASYAHALGLAFQIADDILDVEGDEAQTGKRVQKDVEAGKATFVSLMGLEAARRAAQSLVKEACDALRPYGANAENLRQAARFVISRQG